MATFSDREGRTGSRLGRRRSARRHDEALIQRELRRLTRFPEQPEGPTQEQAPDVASEHRPPPGEER